MYNLLLTCLMTKILKEKDCSEASARTMKRNSKQIKEQSIPPPLRKVNNFEDFMTSKS